MILKITIITLQIVFTIQQIYDEDIQVAYPAQLEYHRVIPISKCKHIEINNCTCKEIPNLEIICSGHFCESIPPIFNTTVQVFKIKLTSLISIERDDLIMMSHLEALEIEANPKLEKIAPGVFRKMSQLCNLTISTNTKYKYLEANVFEGLVNLKTLHIKKNGFKHVFDVTKALSPTYLPNLLILDMRENIFHEIFEHDFLSMNGSKLNELNMILCELENIHMDSLKYLRNLTDLRLGQNFYNRSVITDLVERTLQWRIPLNNINLYDAGLQKIIPKQLMQAIGRSNITRLCLAKNHFNYINEGSFPDMPQLLLLDLRDNSIVEITVNAFESIPNLKYLLLGENKLSNVPQGALLKTIKLLDLSGNPIAGYWPSYFSIQDCKFKNMSKLDNLQLPYNVIGTITPKSFKGLTNLTILNLKNTSISFLELGSFQPLVNLLHLNLINNFFPLFMPLSADMFKGLSKLQVLLLGGCSITNLTSKPSIFTHMPNLIYLGLERNSIHSILAFQLLPLIKLTGINVAENKITTWKNRMFNQSGIKTFFGQQNKISYITTAMLEDLQSVETLLLDDNPFTCDCTWLSVVTWSDTYKIATRFKKFKDQDIASCIGPAQWRHVALLDFINNLTIDPNQCKQNSSDINLIVVPIVSCIAVIALIFICCCTLRIYRQHMETETRIHKIFL